jgi:hypothetical protein
MKRAVLTLVIVMGWACATAPAPSTVPTVMYQLSLAIEKAQTTEIDFYRQGVITADDHRSWQLRFKALGQGLSLYARSQQPTERDALIRQMGRVLGEMSTTLTSRIADPTTRLVIQATLDGIAAALARHVPSGSVMSWTLRPQVC